MIKFAISIFELENSFNFKIMLKTIQLVINENILFCYYVVVIRSYFPKREEMANEKNQEIVKRKPRAGSMTKFVRKMKNRVVAMSVPLMR